MAATDGSVAGAFGAALVGTWELFLREDRTGAGVLHPEPNLGAAPSGYLVYDSGGHFCAQFMKRDRIVGATPTGASSLAGRNNSRAIDGYDAYFGRYTVDEITHTVTQTLDGALAVENVGMVVTRRMEIAGDELTLRLPTTAADGSEVVRTLKWRRVA